ncbi:hypothetical protein CAEBREN_03713 [Caenorhabditis brenneri]|uniref:F-box domain-containing protein n=1 Tax=Caenorhabditis brenneri TaxID=135651 RepID=G0NIV4_CAEBE|nr:hypothetical protein CAEBREN_03713 [Caenorhabditis brenneri]
MSSTTSPSLIDMPDLALKEIFGHVGWKSLNTLRLVSKDLCNFIDIVKPKIRIDSLRIKLTPKSVQIELNSSLQKSKVEIHDNGNSTFAVSGTKKICQGSTPFLSVTMEILETLLSRQNGLIGKLQLEIDDKYTKGTNREFLEKFLKLLESIGPSLRVREIDLEGSGPQAFQLLARLDSKFLKKISISRAFMKLEEIRDTELMMLEQWKSAEQIRTFGYYFSVPIQEFFHFGIAEFHITEVSGDELAYLKEKYSNSTNFKSSTIHYSHLKDSKDLDQILGEPFENNVEFNEKTWYFKCADPDFALFLFFGRILFRFVRVPISKVPKEVSFN